MQTPANLQSSMPTISPVSATLYHYPMSRSARILMALAELDIVYTVQTVNVLKGEGQTDYFKSLNPNGTVPVLSLNFKNEPLQVIFESAAILLYLTEAFPDAGLAPNSSDKLNRARFLETMLWMSNQVDGLLWSIRLNRMLYPEALRNPAIVQRNLTTLKTNILPQIEAKLLRTRWIAADNFTVADCVTTHNLLWMNSLGIHLGESADTYLRRVQQRPSYGIAFGKYEKV